MLVTEKMGERMITACSPNNFVWGTTVGLLLPYFPRLWKWGYHSVVVNC